MCLVSEVSGCHSPLFVRGKNAVLCRTTAWNAVRQCALWLDEPGPPPSLELKIAGIIELKLADKQRGHELKQAAQNSSWRSLLQWISSKTNMIVSNKTFSSKTIVDYNHGFFGRVGGLFKKLFFRV